MRLAFDIDDDEDAAHAARAELVELFAGWLEANPGHDPADAGDAELLLGWKWGYGDGNYARWTAADVDEVLLEHLPRKLSAPPDLAATIPASLAAFVEFLAETHLLDPDGDPGERVAARALAQQRSFLDAMADPGNFGMAKALFSSAGFEPGSVPDQATLDAAMARFNALSFDERGRILGLGTAGEADLVDPDLPELPIRPLPAAGDLDRLAADVPLVRQIDALHAALGPDGIKLTKAGNPTLADGRRLVAATGVDDRTEGIRSSADLPRLFALGQIGRRAGALEIDGDRLRATATWATETSGTRWQRIVDAVLEEGPSELRFGAAMSMPQQLAHVADDGVYHFLALLWMAGGDPVPPAVYEELVAEASPHYLDPAQARTLPADARAETCRARVDDIVTVLAEAGVVTRTSDGILLTDSGARLVAPGLAEEGFDIVLPENLAALDAGELLDLVAERDDDPAAVTAIWTERHEPHRAADEIVAALLAKPEPARLLSGFALLEPLGDAAIEAVKATLDSPLAPHAWLFLASAGAADPEDLPPSVVIEAGIDLLLATAGRGSPADAVELLLDHIPAAEQPRFLDDLAAGSHPRTAEALELLGRHHPTKAVAKHARKAAHRWRSTHGTRNR